MLEAALWSLLASSSLLVGGLIALRWDLTQRTIGLVMACHEASRSGWDSAATVIAFVIGVLALLALPWVEGRARNPMIDFSLLRSRRFVAALLASVACSSSRSTC